MKAVPPVVCCLPLVGVCVSDAADEGGVGVDPLTPLVDVVLFEFHKNLLRNVRFGMGGGVAKEDDEAVICCCC